MFLWSNLLCDNLLLSGLSRHFKLFQWTLFNILGDMEFILGLIKLMNYLCVLQVFLNEYLC